MNLVQLVHILLQIGHALLLGGVGELLLLDQLAETFGRQIEIAAQGVVLIGAELLEVGLAGQNLGDLAAFRAIPAKVRVGGHARFVCR